MAVNRAAKRDRSARQFTEASNSLAGTCPAGIVNHEELLLNTSLGTIGNSSHGVTSSLLAANNHSALSWQSEVSSIFESVSPIQVETSPPDSQEVVGKTDATVTGSRYRSNTVLYCGAASKVVQDAATTVNEAAMLQSLRAPANNFKPKYVTLKSVDAVKRDHRTRKMTILFIGNVAVGKTSLINRIRHKQFQPIHNATIDMTPTIIGATVRGQNYTVRLLDTAGEERFQSIMQSFYRHGNGAMVVYDLTDYSSFDNITDWKLTLQDHCATEDYNFPTILLGNKADENSKHINGSEIADDLKMDGFFKTSAKSGEGIIDAIKMMIYLIDSRCRNDLKFLSQDNEVIQLSNQNDHQPKQKSPRYKKC